MANNAFTETKVITGVVRFSYVHVFQPHAINEEGEKKYSASILIDKADKDTISKVKKAIDIAKERGKSEKWGGKIPAKLKLPLRDGDEEREDEAYAGQYYVNAVCNTRPGLVDKNLNAIIDPEELYSGCYGRASLTFYPFDKNGNRGVACGLNNLQKLKDGEPLGGRVSAEVDFAEPVEIEDDDDLM
jgi:hypothetical protein